MAYDRAEFNDLTAARKRQKVINSHTGLERLAQAALVVQAVTHDPHWDYFLSLIQGMIEQAELAHGALIDKLVDPLTVNPEQILALHKR